MLFDTSPGSVRQRRPGNLFELEGFQLFGLISFRGDSALRNAISAKSRTALARVGGSACSRRNRSMSFVSSRLKVD
jgi:hypothetical protein